MSTRIDIENELRQLQSPLAGLAPVNVFTVPHGYFEGLAASVLRTVQGDTILQRLADTEVPKGYFEGLAGNILARIKAQETAQQADEEPLSPLLQSLRGHNVFTVPEGYFEGLGHDIVNQLSQNGPEQEPLSPLLQSLRGHNVFTVPEGYFEGLGEQIAAALRPKTKVVSLRSRLVRYAAAAVVAGMMALGVYQYSSDGPPSGTPPVLALTEVQKQGIALSKDEAQFNKELEAVSGEAIVQFLTANGSDVEEALAAAAANDTELPNEEDLMLDDKVLDDFLNGTGKGNNN